MRKKIFISCSEEIREQIEKKAECLYKNVAVLTKHIDDADIFLVVNGFENTKDRNEAEKLKVKIIYVDENLIQQSVYLRISGGNSR